MSVYQFASPSPVDTITFAKAENGGLRAYLHASATITPEAIQQLTQKLHEKNYQAIPSSLEGKPALIVRNIKNEKSFLTALGHLDPAIASPVQTQGDEQPQSLIDKIKNRTLQISGGFYLVGDANFIRYGWKNASKEDMMGGVLYMLGTLSLLAFGRNDQSDLQVADYGKKLEKFLIKENVRIPQACALHKITDDHQGTGQHAYDWMRSHPAELFNYIYIGAGAMLAAAAVKHKVMPIVNGHVPATSGKVASAALDVGLGLTTASSALIGNLIEEKHRDPDDPLPKGMIERTLNWVQEKPLRVTGYGMMLSTLCHGTATAIDYAHAVRTNDIQAKGAIPNRAMFVATNLVAEALIALSSKGHGHGVTSDDSVKESVMAMAAETIVKQPEADRAMLIDHVASFLEKPTVLATSKDEVVAKLNEQVTALQKNPWACANIADGKSTHNFEETVAQLQTIKKQNNDQNWTLDKLSNNPAAIAAINQSLTQHNVVVLPARLGGNMSLVVETKDHMILRITDTQIQPETPHDKKMLQPIKRLGNVAGFTVEVFPKALTLPNALAQKTITPEAAQRSIKQLVGDYAKQNQFLWDVQLDNFCVSTDKYGQPALSVLDGGAVTDMKNMHQGKVGNDTHCNLDKFAISMSESMQKLGAKDTNITANPEAYIHHLNTEHNSAIPHTMVTLPTPAQQKSAPWKEQAEIFPPVVSNAAQVNLGA